jgi:cytochrome c556
MFDEVSPVKVFFLTLSFVLCALVTIQCTTEQNNNNSTKASQQEVKKAKKDTPELADAMGQLQTYFHKYALAVDAKNHELATFYFHEVRAAADGIKENIPGYEGYDIKKFMTLMFDPAIEPTETALANRNWEEVRKKTIELSDSCNSCHNATAHGFVKITPGFNNNPFNQDFSAPEE